jgi:hypothetical protein
MLTSVVNGGPDQVVPRIAAQFSTCNIDELLANYLPEVEFVSPGTPRPLFGIAAIRSYFQEACPGSSLPVMQVEVQRVRLLSREAAVVTGSYSFGRSDKPDTKPWPAFFVAIFIGASYPNETGTCVGLCRIHNHLIAHGFAVCTSVRHHLRQLRSPP